MSELSDVGRRAVEAAMSRGASKAEAYLSDDSVRSIRGSEGKVEYIRGSRTRGVGLRVAIGDRVGHAYQVVSDDQSLSVLAEDAVAAANVIDDSRSSVPELSQIGAPDLELGRGSVLDLSTDQASQVIEEAQRFAQSKEALVSRHHIGVESTEVAIVNSGGGSATYSGFLGYQWMEAVAQGENTGAGTDSIWSRFSPLQPMEEMAQRALEQAKAHSKPQAISSQMYTCLLAPQASVNLVSRLIQLLSGAAVINEDSLFASIGETVSTSLLSVVDDPTLASGLGSLPFDGEGIVTQPKTLIAEGKINDWLSDLSTAKTLGLTPGNAQRSSYRGMPQPGASNIFIQPGSESREACIDIVSNGIWVEEIVGLHAANPVTGDFGAFVRGRAVTNGSLGPAIRTAAISGSFKELLGNVVAVASDLRFFSGRASIGSPTVVVDGLRLEVTK